MQPNSGLIEIGWHRWPTGLYTDMARRIGLLTQPLNATHPVINWEVYKSVNGIEKLREEDKRQRVEEKVWWFTDANPYKFADAHLDEYVFVSAVKDMFFQLSEQGVRT